MTMQSGDILRFKNKDYYTENNFLFDYLKQQKIETRFEFFSTAVWRGYQCICEIRNNRIFLIDIEAYVKDFERINVNYFFPNLQEVFTYWYTGEIRVNEGNVIKSNPFGDIREKTYVLKCVSGVIISKKTLLINEDLTFTEIKDNLFEEPILDWSSYYMNIVNDVNTYPFIKLPYSLEYIEKTEYPYLNKLEKPSKPLKPIAKKKHLKIDLFLPFTFIIISVINYLITYDFTIPIILFICIIVYLLFLVNIYIENNKEHEKNIRNYKKNKTEYTNKCKNIDKENKIRQKKIKNIKANGSIIEFKNKQFIKTTSTYKYVEINPMVEDFCIKGRFEEKFANFLKTIFDENILTDISFDFSLDYYDYDNSQYYSRYTPDIIYKDKNISINIEIDEPYTIDNEPIHFKEDKREIKRNTFFVNNNWLVIRFSENQIATQPEKCAHLISYIIAKYTGDLSFFNKFNSKQFNSLNIDIEERWSKLDSYSQMRKKRRETTKINSTLS